MLRFLSPTTPMKSAGVIVLGILVGVTVGLGLYTFVYAKGYSYLTNDPNACTNCHVMRDYYDGWVKSSHRAAATCNDCHTPHNFAGKYAVKVANGFSHSFAFTSGRFPDVIFIKGYNHRVTEGTCLYCHAEIATAMVGVHKGSLSDISCLECHFNVGHSAASYTMSVAPTSPAERNEKESSYGNQ